MKSVISCLIVAGVVSGTPRTTTVAAQSAAKQQSPTAAYTITRPDSAQPIPGGAPQSISENGIVVGNALSTNFWWVWSKATGVVELTFGGTGSQANAMSPNGIVAGSADTPTGEVRGFVWTAAEGMVDIGGLGGEFVTPQGVNSSGVVVGDATLPDGRSHAFMWTKAGGMTDLDPGGTDSTARFVTEDGSLVIGSIFESDSARVFTWTPTTGITVLESIADFMYPAYMNRHGALAGDYFRIDGTEGTFYWSRETGVVDIGFLGGNEIHPTAIGDGGHVIGIGKPTLDSDDFQFHGFVWTLEDGLLDLGTFGGDQSWAAGVNPDGLVTGYATTAKGHQRAFVWTKATGVVDIGLDAKSQARGLYVTDAGAVIGETNAFGTGHALNPFVWTPATGMLAVPSLGHVEFVTAANRSGTFAGFIANKSKKERDAYRAVVWTPIATSPARRK